MIQCSVEHGMGCMCRYSYLSGACANKHVESLSCIGKDKCEFSGMNILMRQRHSSSAEDCGLEKWLGLYCEKYRRFFCPGRENCVTPESYRKHLQIRQDQIRDLAHGEGEL
ncbi:MAG TPA: hypothetical protein VGB78_00035 [Thermoplasmata archaeon]